MKINKKIATALALVPFFITMVTTISAIVTNKYRRVRRFGVRPMNRDRDKEGLFVTLFKAMKELEWDGEQFYKYTRMTKN